MYLCVCILPNRPFVPPKSGVTALNFHIMTLVIFISGKQALTLHRHCPFKR